MSVVLRGQEGKEYKDSWITWRTVQVVGYHSEERTVESLFQHHLENKLEGRANYFYALHPGSISAELLPGWPMPHHPDEPTLPLKFNPPEFKHPRSLLETVYKEQFRKEEDRVIWKDFLLAWDGWASEYDPGSMEEKPIHTWPNGKGELTIESQKEALGVVPFTVLKFGPFTKKGPVLINYRTKLQEDSYDDLFGACGTWVIDGPESLLHKIRRHIYENPSLRKFSKELKRFEDFLAIGESYDIMILNSESADPFEFLRGNGIVKAPVQPPKDFPAVRFISASPRFSLALGYADSSK